MSENSKIEWTDHTFNPWEGCQKVGPGCDHCYAEARNARFGGGSAPNWGPVAPRRRTSPANWRKPIVWNAAHAEFFATNGRRQRVFCASLADVFDNAVDHAWLADLFDLIARTPNLDWLLLTKRIGNVKPLLQEVRPMGDREDGLSQSHRKLEHWGHCVADDWLNGKPPKNVWLGATIVNQEEADRDIPKLLAAPAVVRFLSMEPLLGPVQVSDFLTPSFPSCAGFVQGEKMEEGYCNECAGHVSDPIHKAGSRDSIDWVIVGGESGAGARPTHPDWARSLRDQCAAASVPFLFKQNGEWASVSEVAGAGAHFAFNDGATVRRVGKKIAGRALDGVTHDGFPPART